MMELEPRYSVIIPVYNAEKTIGRCLDSLLRQRRKDIQILLVNDGSTDASAEVCRQYAERFAGIIFIDQENSGVSSARNAGLEMATGKYILFVDSDDFVEENYFEILDKVPEDITFVMFSYRNVEGKRNGTVRYPDFYSRDTEQTWQKISEALYRKTLNHPVTKRYLRRIIVDNGIRFPKELYIGEDKVFNLRYALCCRDCFITSSPIYCVSLGNENSLSRKRRQDFERQMWLIDQEIQQALSTADIPENFHQKLDAAENLICLRSIYSRTKRMHQEKTDTGARWRMIWKMCAEFNSKRLRLPNGMFARILAIPVKIRLVGVIDLLGWKLAN